MHVLRNQFFILHRSRRSLCLVNYACLLGQSYTVERGFFCDFFLCNTNCRCLYSSTLSSLFNIIFFMLETNPPNRIPLRSMKIKSESTLSDLLINHHQRMRKIRFASLCILNFLLVDICVEIKLGCFYCPIH